MILVDLSQVIMSGVIVQLSNDLKKPGVDAANLIKHMIFSTLLSFKQKYGKEYGEMVLCCDSKKYWRREYFPYYKGHRKHDREKSDIDWSVVLKAINEVKDDLREYFPYKILEVELAEADDIIACMVKYLQENELVSSGLMCEDPQKILICSSDGDFSQLQKYPGVKQWNNQHKKFVVSANPKQDLLEKICSGDTGDNIPGVLTSDKWSKLRSENAEEKIRQTPLKKTLLAEFVERGIDACKNEEQKRNFIRNENLISFDKIPDHIYNSIIESYQNYEKKGSRAKLMSYFTKNKMRLLFAEINNF